MQRRSGEGNNLLPVAEYKCDGLRDEEVAPSPNVQLKAIIESPGAALLVFVNE